MNDPRDDIKRHRQRSSSIEGAAGAGGTILSNSLPPHGSSSSTTTTTPRTSRPTASPYAEIQKRIGNGCCDGSSSSSSSIRRERLMYPNKTTKTKTNGTLRSLRVVVAMAIVGVVFLQVPVLLRHQRQQQQHTSRRRPTGGIASNATTDDDADSSSIPIDLAHLRTSSSSSAVTEPTSDNSPGQQQQQLPRLHSLLDVPPPGVSDASRTVDPSTPPTEQQGAATTSQAAARKPRMYLDVGPYKTGTTFLQCALSRNLYDFLQHDHFLYLGTCAHECKRKKGWNAAKVVQGPTVTAAADATAGNNTPSSSNRPDAAYDDDDDPPPPPPPPPPYEFCVGHSADSLVYGKNHSLIAPLQNKLRGMQNERPRRDALIVWEYLSDLHPLRMHHLVEELQRGGWEIHLIAHYRRLYEWLPSLHAQFVKPGWNGRPHLMVWPGDKLYRPRQQQKAGNGGIFARKPFGEPIPTFTYYPPGRQRAAAGRKYQAILDEIERTRRHPTDAAIQLWLPHASAVHVVDLHRLRKADASNQPNKNGDDDAVAGGGGGDPLLEEIFCRIIPRLNRTCDAIRSNQIEILDAGKNERFDKSNYDLLAVSARQQGLYPRGEFRLSRPHAWDVIQHYQEVVLNRTAVDFPLTCIPADALDEFRNLSMTVEARFLPGREEEHAAGFDEAVRRNKFCHVDANQTLQLPEWRAFFKPAVVVGPVVVDRQKTGQWFPSFDVKNQSILEVFYPNPAGRPIKHSMRQIEFLGFINAAGTDTDRLVNAVSSSDAPMSHFQSPTRGQEGGSSSGAELLGCVFGPRFETNAGRDSSVTMRPASCPKTTYVTLIAEWVKGLPRLKGMGQLPSTTVDDKSSLVLNPSLVVQALLTPVIMVRNPLDRLLALWSKQARSPNDNETFASWLDALGSDPQRRKMGLMVDQFRSIAADPQRAISAISHDARVLVLVHECYDLSLHILKERHPVLLNWDSLIGETIDEVSHLARDRIDNITYLGLEDKARTWFDSEYQFYDAAVGQFRKLIAVSESLDEEQVKACLDKLG